MYVNNTTKAEIKDISFEGYWFTLPVGVSLVWDKLGTFLTQVIYKMDGAGGGMPPVLPATADQWDGKRYAEVRRFDLNSALIPKREDLIKIAKARGVDAAKIEEWKEDETIDNREIAQVINQLSVPDSVKYPPVEVAAKTAAPKAEDLAADAAIAEASKETAPPAQGPDAVADKVPAAPKTAGKTAAAKTAAKAVAKAPTTPKKPAAAK